MNTIRYEHLSVLSSICREDLKRPETKGPTFMYQW